MAKARSIPRQASSPLHTLVIGGFTTEAASDGWVGVQKAVEGVGAGKGERKVGLFFSALNEKSLYLGY